MTVSFSATLWRFEGPTAWYFVTLPIELGGEIRQIAPKGLKGFGSISVRVSCQGEDWRTSIFPDSKSGSYVLPIKAAVRSRLTATVGTSLEVRLELGI